MPDYGQLGNYLFNTHLRATGSARSAILPNGAQLNSIVIQVVQKRPSENTADTQGVVANE